MVGAAGFEPTTSSTPRKRSTKLSHAPNHKNYYTDYMYNCQRFFLKFLDFFYTVQIKIKNMISTRLIIF